MPIFHKKHYSEIAQLVARISSIQDRLNTYLGLNAMFQRDNPAFDEEKFREACCVPEIAVKEVKIGCIKG